MYECNANDRNELESIQGQILERIQYLRERNLDIATDEIYSIITVLMMK